MPKLEELKRFDGPSSVNPASPLLWIASLSAIHTFAALDPTPWLSPSSPISSFQLVPCWRQRTVLLTSGFLVCLQPEVDRSPLMDWTSGTALCGVGSPWQIRRVDANPSSATSTTKVQESIPAS